MLMYMCGSWASQPVGCLLNVSMIMLTWTSMSFWH